MEKFSKLDVLKFPIIRKRKEGIRVKEWRKIGEKEALILYNELQNKKICSDPIDELADLFEKLGYEIAKLLGVNCAEIHLGKANEKKCCISFNFLRKSEKFYNGDAILPEDTAIDEYISSYEECEILFSRIFNTFEELNSRNCHDMKEDFLKMVLFDFLLGNSDRDNRNWGVILNKKTEKYRMAPIFDNTHLFRESREVKDYCDYNIKDYDALIDYVIDNYFHETKDFIKNMEQKITREKLEEIFYKLDDGRDLKKDQRINFILRRKDFILEKYKSVENDYKHSFGDNYDNYDYMLDNLGDRINEKYGSKRYTYDKYDF